jgi:hypothetical protein
LSATLNSLAVSVPQLGQSRVASVTCSPLITESGCII